MQQIEFQGGLTISRGMACYWRNDRHRLYLECKAFVESLLTGESPRAPHFEKAATTARLLNEKFSQHMRARSEARKAATSTAQAK